MPCLFFWVLFLSFVDADKVMFSRVFVLVSSLVLSLHSAEISWRSTVFQDGETSQGAPLTSSWTFHLGFFGASFAPSSANTTQWGQNWTTVDVSSYSDSFSRFVGVWEDDGSVPNHTKGYIWGFNRGSASREWILMSASDWTWPLPPSSPIDPTGGEVVWDVDSANQVIVGQVNQGGVHMRTASVSGESPLLEGDFWLRLYFNASELQDGDVSGFSADPDGDGSTNLEEFAFGTDPREIDSPEVCATVSSGFLEFTVERAEKVGVIYVGQVSSDLEGWAEGSSHVLLVNEASQSLTYRDLTPLSASSRRFGRVRVVLAP